MRDAAIDLRRNGGPEASNVLRGLPDTVRDVHLQEPEGGGRSAPAVALVRRPQLHDGGPLTTSTVRHTEISLDAPSSNLQLHFADENNGRRGIRTHISRFVGPGFLSVELAAHCFGKISLRLTFAIACHKYVMWDPTLEEGGISRLSLRDGAKNSKGQGELPALVLWRQSVLTPKQTSVGY